MAIIGMALAAFLYLDSARLSTEAEAIFNDSLRLTGMLAAQARNEPNRDQLEQFRRELQAKYEPTRPYELSANELSSRVLDRAFDLKSAARCRVYCSSAAAGLGVLGAATIFFRRRKTSPPGKSR